MKKLHEDLKNFEENKKVFTWWKEDMKRVRKIRRNFRFLCFKMCEWVFIVVDHVENLSIDQTHNHVHKAMTLGLCDHDHNKIK